MSRLTRELVAKAMLSSVENYVFLALTDVKPAIGQRTGKNDKTHWIIFVKD